MDTGMGKRGTAHGVPFYGKECNYCFPADKEEGFHALFEGGRKGHGEDDADMEPARWDSVDTCVLWAAYKAFEENKPAGHWESVRIQDIAGKPVMELAAGDDMLEAAWLTLTDVNVDEDGYTEQGWLIFPKGTHQEDIWHWFDGKHSKGAYWLLYCFDGNEWLKSHRQG